MTFPTPEDGKSLEFKWNGTELGVRVEGDVDYQFVDVKGEKGDSITADDVIYIGDKQPTGSQVIWIDTSTGSSEDIDDLDYATDTDINNLVDDLISDIGGR